MKKILVTGGCGFIGSNFIQRAIKNYKILNIDKLTYASNKSYLKNLITNKNYSFKKIDICHKNLMKLAILKFKPNYLINFAAESHVDNSIKNADEFINTNVKGVMNLLNIIRDNKKKLPKNFRFFQISTDEVFGDIALGKYSKETDVYHPSSPYSASKASADHLVKAWSRTYGIDFNITYSSNNYGPNQNTEKFIPVIINSVIKNKKIPIYGDGKQRRDWIYVDDNVDGIIQVLKAGKKNATYNIGVMKSETNINLVKIILKILVKDFNFDKKIFKLLSYIKDRLGHDRNYNLSNSKLKKIGWRQKYSIENGLKKTISWYLKEFEVLK